MSKTLTIQIVCVLLLSATGLTACADSFVFVSLLQKQKIVTFHRNMETGELARHSEMDCPAEPAFLAASEDGRILFVTLRSSGQLAAFRIDPSNGQLTLINIVEGGEDPAFLVADRSGKFLLTAYYVSDKVTVHSIASEGRLSEAPVQSVATADNAHGIGIDSENSVGLRVTYGRQSNRSVSIRPGSGSIDAAGTAVRCRKTRPESTTHRIASLEPLGLLQQ